MFNSDSHLFITGDESRLYCYDIQTKVQSSQWKRPEEPKPKNMSSSANVKVLLTVFIDYNGMVHEEYLPQDSTVNKEYYFEVVRQLLEAIHEKCTGLWKNKITNIAQ